MKIKSRNSKLNVAATTATAAGNRHPLSMAMGGGVQAAT
jgi:hypothetical protein